MKDSTVLEIAAPSPVVAEQGKEQLLAGKEGTILLVTSLGHGVCHLGELLFPAVMVAVMGEFGLEPDQATLLVYLGYVLMGVGALPVGLWADASDPWRIHLFYLLAMVVSCGVVALAGNPTMLFVGLTLLGLATSIYHPIALAMISLGIRRSNMAMGINGVAGSIGMALAPILGRQASAVGTWQLAYWAVALLAGGSALIMLLTWKNRFKMPEYEVGTETSSGSTGGLGFPWLLGSIMVLGGFNYRCLVTALPNYLDGASVGGDKAGLATALAMIAGCVGQIVGGKLGDRLGCRPVYLGMVLALVPMGLLLGFFSGTALAIVMAAGYSLCLFGIQPVENTLLAENTSTRRRSLSYGIRFVMTFGVGAIGAHVVGMVWKQTGSVQWIFFLLAVSAGLMGGLLGIWFYFHPGRRGMESAQV